MRDLDKANAAARSTRFMFSVALIIPAFMGWCIWALANGAAPGRPLSDNYFAVTGLAIMLLAMIALPVPYFFKWDWRSAEFGASFLAFATGSLGGIYPILCVVWFGNLPLLVRLAIALLECAAIAHWCNRFVGLYQTIYANKDLFNFIYEEDSAAVYFLQRADKKLVEKLLKFEELPKSGYFLASLLIGLVLVPFATSVSKFLGLPFTHVFLAVIATPLNLMFLGLGTKMWLVCYFYPHKIRKATNKLVYIDMSSQPQEAPGARSS